MGSPPRIPDKVVAGALPRELLWGIRTWIVCKAVTDAMTDAVSASVNLTVYAATQGTADEAVWGVVETTIKEEIRREP